MTFEKLSLQAHEEFSLTGKLLETTQKWDQKTTLGILRSRTTNFIFTPLTALIDAVAHLVLGALSVGGLSQLGWMFNGAAYLLSSKKCFPITFTGGLINLALGVKHASAIPVLPFLAALSPEKAADLFKHRASIIDTQLHTEIQEAKKAEAKTNRAKQHVINNVKAAFVTIRKQNSEISQKNYKLINLKNEIQALNEKIVNFKKTDESKAEHSKINKVLIEKVAELEAKNSNLREQHALMSQQNVELLKEKNKLIGLNQKSQENLKLQNKNEALLPNGPKSQGWVTKVWSLLAENEETVADARFSIANPLSEDSF